MLFSLTACGSKTGTTDEDSNSGHSILGGLFGSNDKNSDDKNSSGGNSSNVVDLSGATSKFGGGTIAQLKAAYGAENEFVIKPFYNVEQNTEFTFHFNSYVNPFTAVTVHTDSKCGMNSMVYQYNTGYSTGSGMDVVVSPFQPVLNTDSSKKLEYNNWGYAPIYYLSINYDMFSPTAEKLDEPIIVPFTVTNTISVPNVEGFVTRDGTFGIRWSKVDDAVKYNIYSANPSRNKQYSRQELGYEGDFLSLLTTVDSNTLEFTDLKKDGKENTSSSNGYITFQNYSDTGIYYVTAVDGRGNESFYSYPVESYKFYDRLPYYFDSFTEFVKDDNYDITALPLMVNVTLKNGDKGQYPINYKKIKEQYGDAIYEYSIPGTKLGGEVTYTRSDGNYPATIESDYNFDTLVYEVENNIDKVPSVNVNTISDNDYNKSIISLDKRANRPNNGIVSYSKELAYVRADIEAARMINDGVYGESNPFTMLYDNPNFIIYFDENGSQLGYSSVQGTYRDITMDGGSGVGHTITSIVINNEVVYENTGTGEKVTKPIEDDSVISRDDYIDHEIPEEITSENIVEEQIISTEKQVEEASEEPVVAVSYPVFADSAEEDYIARNMMACEEVINLDAFPKLQNTEYLFDVIFKVTAQNPYVISTLYYKYDPNNRNLLVDYLYSKEVVEQKQQEIYNEATKVLGSIIKNGMNNEEKIEAIWDYLENNTSYDRDALAAAERYNFDASKVLENYGDSFNTYGILCKKVGVCQSYAYVFKLLCSMVDVDSVVLNGYLDRTLPHAWNAVKLDGGWYWVDVTNNSVSLGIPYYLYQSSSDYANYAGFILDDTFELDSNLTKYNNADNSKDFYAEHNLLFDNLEDSLINVCAMYLQNRQVAFVKCVDLEALKVMESNSQEVIGTIGMALYQNGATEAELNELMCVFHNGIIFLMRVER